MPMRRCSSGNPNKLGRLGQHHQPLTLEDYDLPGSGNWCFKRARSQAALPHSGGPQHAQHLQFSTGSAGRQAGMSVLLIRSLAAATPAM